MLSWLLLLHLPNKDKQIENKDKQLTEILEKKWQMTQNLLDRHKEEIKLITDHCAQEMEAVTNIYRTEVDKIVVAIKEIKK